MKVSKIIAYLGVALFFLFSCTENTLKKEEAASLWTSFKEKMAESGDVSTLLADNYKEKYLTIVNDALFLPKDSFWLKPILDQYRILYVRHKIDQLPQEYEDASFDKLFSDFGLLELQIAGNLKLDTIIINGKGLAYGFYKNGSVQRSVRIENTEEGLKMDFFRELPQHIETQETLITRRMQLFGSAQLYYINLLRANTNSEALFDPIAIRQEIK